VEPRRGAQPVLIRFVAETGSTNADLLARARDGAAEGEWLLAERQTAGKGRQGRAWASPPGNLYASTLVRLRPGDPAAATLGFVAAVSLCERVRDLGVRASLKWPNDLLVGGAKLSGILLERVDDAVVVGIGVNLAHHPDLPDRRTTSLAAQGVAIAPAAFAEQLAVAVATWLARWRSDGFAPVRSRWLELAHPCGTPLAVHLPDGISLAGTFAGLDPGGALVLDLPFGERRTIHAADVFLV
jgi:BirA family transcriptional regulator, biotin operon repressor / biotin---[acetyl-CoA-carboxylase] ligase